MGEAPVGCRFRGRARGVAVAVSVDVRFILERDIRSRGVEANVELVKEHGQNTLKAINPFTATLAALSRKMTNRSAKFEIIVAFPHLRMST